MDQVPCHKKCYYCGYTWARYEADLKCDFIYEEKFFCDANCFAHYWDETVDAFELKEDEFLTFTKIKIKTCQGCEKDL
jgi:hypothetical protein